MAKQFFKNLPDTSTPLTAPRLNDLLDGEESMGNIVVEGIRSKNMFDKNNVINNYRLDSGGDLYSDNGYFTSIFIPVNSSTQYAISRANANSGGLCSFALYDSSKTFISRSEFITTTTYTFTTTQDAKYLRIADLNNNIDSLQLEKGSNATTYSPYQNLDGKDTVILTSGTLGNYFSTVDSNLVAKSGNVVQIQFRALVSTTIPNNGTFYTVPYHPRFGSANEILIGVGGEYDYNTGIKWGYVDRSGALRGESIPAGKWIHINTTYITKD